VTTPDAGHGTRSRYVGGAAGPPCRCDACREANRVYNSQRERQQLYGRWRPWVDAAPAREHLLRLQAAGIGRRRAAELAGVPPTVVSRLLYGKAGGPPRERIRPGTAARILAVDPGTATPAPGVLVDATGTRRRLQALVAAGWSQARLAGSLGMTGANFGTMLHSGGQVTAARAGEVRDLYDRMWNRPPPQATRHEKIAASRARSYAAGQGWPVPLGWDEEALDDPHGKPAEGWRRGSRHTHRSADLTEDYRELARREGYTREHAAARLGVSLTTLENAILRTQRREAERLAAEHEAQRAMFTAAAEATEPQADYEAEAG